MLFGKNLTVRVILEYVVQKSCFAAPEEAGQDRHGHPLLLHGRLFFEGNVRSVGGDRAGVGCGGVMGGGRVWPTFRVTLNFDGNLE